MESLSLRDVELLREAVWHAVQRGDVPDGERLELHNLYSRLVGGPTKVDVFKNPTDELHYNLVRAERHAQQALDLLYQQGDPKRSIWFRMAVGRAQSILMSLYVRDIRIKG